MKSFLSGNIFRWIFFVGIYLFSSYTSNFSDQVSRWQILASSGSINSYYFYTWHEPFFLDFHFYGLHPYYLFLSLLGIFFQVKFVIIILFFIFVLILYFAVRFEIITSQIMILWLLTSTLLFKYNGTALLTWLQFLLYLVYTKINLSHFKFSSFTSVVVNAVFYVLLSLIFLPGLVLIFSFHVINFIMDQQGVVPNVNAILTRTGPFLLSFVILWILHIIIALFVFQVPADKILNYVLLPISIYETNYKTNNISWVNVLFINIDAHKYLYLTFMTALAIWSMVFKDKNSLYKVAGAALFLLAGMLITCAQSPYFVLTGFFFFYTNEQHTVHGYRKMQFAVLASLLLVFLNQVRSPAVMQKSIMVVDDCIVVCPADLPDLNFSRSNVKKLIIIDLKIIPENVVKLTTNIKAGKIDVDLNESAMRFLDKDIAYEKQVIEAFSKDVYAIYLKSAIHPDQEKWPYRRVYSFWRLLKEKSNDARIVLF